jgi:Resolvase, N terminal domain
MPIFGYARVSANGQNLADQIAELEAVVCGKIYREKISGATAGGPELAKLLRAIGLRRRGESFAPRRMALHSGFTERGERDACKGPALRSCARNRGSLRALLCPQALLLKNNTSQKSEFVHAFGGRQPTKVIIFSDNMRCSIERCKSNARVRSD